MVDPESGHPALELGAGEALAGDDGESGERDPLETPYFAGLRAASSQPAGNLESIV
jgi:hypothetical protein